MSEYDVQAQKLRKQQAMIQLISAMISLGFMVWYLLPEHQRKLMAMRLTERSRQLADRAAQKAGHQSMGVELATGHKSYGLPYLLSRTRDWLRSRYDKLREVH